MDRQLYFPSFILQFGRPQSVTCQQYLYYTGEAREKKKKKHALRCFHISSVVFVGKNMLKYHRFFLLLLSLFHLQQSAFRWKQILHGMISLCFKSPCALPGSQAQCRTCDRATIPGRVDKPSRCGFLGKG